MISFAATIGADGLYLVFVWLLSAAGAAWVAERKGYGERVGLTFGLLLSALGFVIVLLLPGRPRSKWRVEGWLPPRGGQTERPSPPEPPPSQGASPG
jgi:hypothetical protein